jgi:hypothetical protein
MFVKSTFYERDDNVDATKCRNPECVERGDFRERTSALESWRDMCSFSDWLSQRFSLLPFVNLGSLLLLLPGDLLLLMMSLR